MIMAIELKMLARHPDAAEPDGSAVVQHHGLGEHAVDVQWSPFPSKAL
jgi:hypothetical protein